MPVSRQERAIEGKSIRKETHSGVFGYPDFLDILVSEASHRRPMSGALLLEHEFWAVAVYDNPFGDDALTHALEIR